MLKLFGEVRWPLAGMMVFMNLAVALERVVLAMGRSRLVLGLGLLGSWAGQVPLVVALTQLWRNDLVALYTGVALGYALLDVMYAYVVLTADWDKYALEKKEQKEGAATDVATAASEDDERGKVMEGTGDGREGYI